MSVIGFDFGTESCIISVCKRGSKGGPDVIQNEVGNRKTSTMVAYTYDQRFIGDSAVSQAMGNAKNTVHSFKNLLRVNRMDHPDMKHEQQFLPYKLVDLGNGAVGIEVQYASKKETLSAQQVAGAMLGKLKTIAEEKLGVQVIDCVISVGPMWTDEERRGLLDSAKIAGLNVLRLMNETLAVAVTYGLLRRLAAEPFKVLFVDVGASHTNASVVQFSEGKLQVLGVDSDHTFGGRNLDLLIFDHLAAQIRTKYNMDVTTNVKATLKLMKESKNIKVKLSANTRVNWAVEYIMNDRDVNGQVTRDELEQMAQPFVPRLRAVVASACQKAGVAIGDLHSCEVVGGGTRIPFVQAAIKEVVGRELSKTCDADESVAKGCALQCAMLSPLMKVRDFDVVDIQPFAIVAEFGTLAASTLERKDDALFAAQGPLPSFSIVAFEGMTTPFQVIARYADPALRGSTRFVISGFPVSFVDENPTVKVKFHNNVHGLVSITRATLMEIEPPEPEPEPMETTPEGEGAEKKDDAAMDTTPDAPEKPEAPEPEKPKKKKYKRTELKVETQTSGMDKKAMDRVFEREAQMAAADKLVVETSLARDKLERYVLDMTGKVQSEYELAPYAQEQEKTAFLAALMREDDWLASDEGYEATKKEYKSKLAALYKFGAPLVNRKFESENRTASVDIVKKMVVKFQTWANDLQDVKYAHISAEQRQSVLAKCTEVDQWISTELAKQDRIPKNQDPSLTKQGLITKAKELDGFCKPIINTPIPTPPKKEEEKKEEPAKTEEPAAEPAAEATAPEGEAMDQTD